MPHDPKNYDDNDQLTAYIWRNYRHLLTPLESLAERALLAESKAAHSRPYMAQRLRELCGANDDPEVIAAIAEGSDAFRERVRNRIMADCQSEITLNRCPKCTRLVVSPGAKLCLWCGYDWH